MKQNNKTLQTCVAIEAYKTLSRKTTIAGAKNPTH